MAVEIFHDQISMKVVADPAGVEPQPPVHQSDAHPTEPPRPAKASDKSIFFLKQKKDADTFVFSFLHKNICCLGYSLEVPRRVTSYEYPQNKGYPYLST